jgi:NADH:ubiquinone oxidoreductase subunit F (NADH-binding)
MADEMTERAATPDVRHERLLAWARRHAAAALQGSAVSDLVAGDDDAEIAARRGLPRATVAGLRSSYDQLDGGTRVCDGTACHFAGGTDLARGLAANPEGRPIGAVRCLGCCYAAPALRSGDEVWSRPADLTPEAWLAAAARPGGPATGTPPIPRRSLADPAIVLRHLLPGASPAGLGEYDLPDVEAILATIEAARLAGRGGAVYPTAAKWRAARDTAAPDRFVVANGDEGDPGSFTDRLLLEEDPHAVLAGMLACARVIGASRGVVYVRAEYPRAQAIVRAAIAEARAAGKLPGFEVEVAPGAGSYVCGEETALLRSIEGLRGEPSPKPPYPSERGLHGLPTVVQNVETLAVVPWIVRHGRESAAIPAPGGGTKAVSVSGAVARPGVVEVALGTPLSTVFHEGAGGPPPGRRWRMALVGGPMGRVVPESRFDVALGYRSLPGMGHAGIVVLDDTVRVRALAEHLFEFARAESCGSCAPCRIGTAQLAGIRDRARLERLLETLEIGSLCGFGQGVPRPIHDLLEHFGDEVLA